MSSIHPMTLSERYAITMATGCRVPILAHASSSIIAGRGKHVEGLCKVPDAAFKYTDRRPNASSATGGCPRVIFEVAVSQTYESVLEDARQWLVRTNGKVVLCIIVKIYEQPKCTKQSGERIAEGPSSSAASLSAFSTDDRLSSMEDRDRFLNSTAEHSRWVGPLSGFLEMYRLSADGTIIVQDGPRYVCHSHIP